MLIDIMKSGDTVSLRLLTGEELVGTLVVDEYETKGFVEVEKPMIIGRAPDGGFGLMPFMITTNATKAKLSSTHIMAMAKTSSEIAKSYIEQVSNIIT